jgi:FkbM family methyltransferase
VSVSPYLYWGFRRWRRGPEEVELELLPVLCSTSRLAVDIGANFGMYTARLSGLSRRCIAFEPIPAFARMLARGFGSRVDVHACALSDTKGTAKLRVPDLFTGYATIDPANALATRAQDLIEEVEVETGRLDQFELADVGFIKIDVEGHEEAVLRGSVATLARCRPNLLVEVEERHNPGSVRRIVTWMADQGFAAVAVVDGVLEDLAEFDLTVHQQTVDASKCARNIVFVPKERQVELSAAVQDVLRGATGPRPH